MVCFCTVAGYMLLIASKPGRLAVNPIEPGRLWHCESYNKKLGEIKKDKQTLSLTCPIMSPYEGIYATGFFFMRRTNQSSDLELISRIIVPKTGLEHFTFRNAQYVF